MNVNALLDGESVVIVGITMERYRALVAYIDAQGVPGNLMVKSVSLTDLDSTGIVIATVAQHN